MALITGDVFMTAVQFKSGAVVVELNRLPPFITMTPCTGGVLPGIKLINMYIRMAIQASAGEI